MPPYRLSFRWALPLGLLVCALWFITVRAADKTTPAAGLRQNPPRVHALTGARLVIAPGREIASGTIVIRDGVIESVGAQIPLPADARVHDLTGHVIYAGFIDAYAELSEEAAATTGGAPYWNGAVTPELRGADHYRPNADLNRKLRGQGITARLWVPARGVIRGTSLLADTSDATGRESLLRDNVALHMQLQPDRRGRDRNAYPGSPMGAVALIRQAFHDADWYRRAWQVYEQEDNVPRPERNDALEVLKDYSGDGKQVMIDVSNELYFLRADRLAREFRLKLLVRGSGDEYRRLDAVAASDRPVIVPLNFPPAPNVKTPEDTRNVTLERLLDWNLAPENPGRLANAGVTIALTTHGLKDPAKFLPQLREAVRRGLAPEAALAALTVAPAEMFGVGHRLGTLEGGKTANLVVTDGDLFDKKSKVVETWVAGTRYRIKPAPVADPRGTWELKLNDKPVSFKVRGSAAKLNGQLTAGDQTIKLDNLAMSDAQLGFTFAGKELGLAGIVRMSGTATDGTLEGTGMRADGTSFTWSAKRTAPAETEDAEEAKDEPPQDAEAKQDENADKLQDGDEQDNNKREDKSAEKIPAKALFNVNYPLGAFGVKASVEQPAAVLFKNATVWTSGPQGILKNASVLVQNGKIAAVGAGEKFKLPEGTQVIDLQGKHLTPGIIDCHSHSATDGGVNEATQTITAEVRIGDFVDADDIQIYRQLAGGVTAINILHGSANTIGGQNQVIKLRWGLLPEQLKFREAPPGIKFALGENVKQSNWGDKYRTRYPQSRMGVEQIVRDAFRAAQEYQKEWASWRPGQGRLPPRVDLELEAIVEILDGKRRIHCHSYRQDEILALLRTCEDFHVRIGTLQHILEGYKVADAIARHGAGGSAFSDWWAYKIEVYDAIPYNGAIMHKAGVVVSFNSDDAELARRLNVEAAKAVKYGGLDEAEALKFVTLNPAIQLGIDPWVGSIEVGKHADLAVWNDSPLSTLAMCEQTWVDGRKYFDRETDRKRREDARSMKAALVQLVLESGAPTGDSHKEQQNLWAREDTFCHGHDHGHDH